MSEARPLPPSALCRRCDPGSFAFATTADLADVPGIIGQERAEEAVRFAIGIRRYGYNLYALGTSGMGKHGFVRAFLEQRAAAEKAPSDWAYVHNFADPRRPRALRLPPGRAPLLREELQRLVEELRAAIPAVFESEDYRTRKKLLEAQLSLQGERVFGGLEERARARGVAIVKTPAGVGMAPLRDGEVIEPEAFSRLPVADQERMKAEMVAIQQELQDALGVDPAGGPAPPRGDAPARPPGHRRRHLQPRGRGAPALGGRAGGARVPRRRGEGRRGQRRGLPAAARGGRARSRRSSGGGARSGRPAATRSTCSSPGPRRAEPPWSTKTTRPTPTSWAGSSTSRSSATSSPTSRSSRRGRCTARTAAT